MSLERDLTTTAEISRNLCGSSQNPIETELRNNRFMSKVEIAGPNTPRFFSTFPIARKLFRLASAVKNFPKSTAAISELLAENHRRMLENARLTEQIGEITSELQNVRATISRTPLIQAQPNSLPTSVNSLSPLWNSYYRAFEDRFRGSEAAISAKQFQYIARIKSHLRQDALVVDLGCGRGEWLKLLKSNGFDVLGVDMNEAMLRDADKSGLKVINQNALEWLSKQASASVDMITAFHVVEHLSANELLQMLAEAARVIKKSGLILLETPNPENLVVGACNFWTDITHVKPIPPQTLGFMLDFLGFSQIDCIRSSPPFEGADPQNPLQAPQDYAIIAQKR